MFALSPRSPLSLSSESNGSSGDMQDNVLISDSDAQPPNTTVLDGIQPHNTSQPVESHRVTFASTLKLKLGSHGSDLKSTLESKLGPQYGLSQPPGKILKGDSSIPSSQTPLSMSTL